jgi:AraC-like DNA-binding protein/mannose-6-phosphate isomerase-like protein (cupin superfamily)
LHWILAMPAATRVLRAYDHLLLAPFVRLRDGKFPAQWAMEQHSHAFVQLLCITSGRGVLITDGEHPFGPGDVVVIPGLAPHAWRVGRAAGLALVDVCLLSEDPRQRTLIGPLLETARAVPGGIVRETVPLMPTLQAIRREVHERQAFAEFRVHGLLWQLIADIAQAARERRNGNEAWAGGADMVLVLERFLEQQYARRLTLADLAEAVHVSPKHLCKVMAREQGCSPMQRLMAVRLRHARDLLLTPAMGIAEVAHAVGLPDHRHFARVFKAATGLSPSDYRADSGVG